MLRKLLILGVFAGTSASIPIVYQSNPQLVENLLKSAAPMPLGRQVLVNADERGHFTSQF
jgi:aspartyl protease family protein